MLPDCCQQPAAGSESNGPAQQKGGCHDDGFVYVMDTLEAWTAYFSTGEAQHFFALMQSLPQREGR